MLRGTVFVKGLIVFQIQLALDLFLHLVLFTDCCSLFEDSSRDGLREIGFQN